MIIKTGFTI